MAWRNITMPKVTLEKVKQVISKLSPEDRRTLTMYLVDFPDSGFQSYDLREELEVLKKYGKRLTGPDNNPDYYLANLIFVRNLVSVQILGTEVLRAVFLPDNFIESFPKSNRKISMAAEDFKKSLFTQELREAMRAERIAQGIQESDAELEKAITETCDSIGELLVTETAKQMAEQITLHLPGMVGDMFCAAIKGQAFADFNAICEEAGNPERKTSIEDIKKKIQKSAWEEVKPHLGVIHGGNRRTDSAWQGNEVRMKYAQRTNERHLLAESIKAMYEDCLGDDGWTEDLRQDSTFQRLSLGVPDEIIAWAIKQVASEDTIPRREREPLSIACIMACQELGLPKQEIETLRSYYTEGKTLIQQKRRKKTK